MATARSPQGIEIDSATCGCAPRVSINLLNGGYQDSRGRKRRAAIPNRRTGMGWATAGQIFYEIARKVIDGGASDEVERAALGPVIDVLRDWDWDTEYESLE